MLTETVLGTFLVSLVYFRVMHWAIALAILGLIYWLPRPLVLLTGKLLMPSVLLKGNHTNNLNSNVLSLTFDDVPFVNVSASWRLPLVEILNKFGQKATLFVIAGYVTSREHETALVHAIQSGHQLANHGQTNTMHALLSADELEREIVLCDVLIKRLYKQAGKALPKVMLYRPGCGVLTPFLLQTARRLQHRVVLGTIYPNDPVVRCPAINLWYLQSHIQTRPFGTQDIVILHDRTWTLTLLDHLLPFLAEHKIKSVPIDNLLEGS